MLTVAVGRNVNRLPCACGVAGVVETDRLMCAKKNSSIFSANFITLPQQKHFYQMCEYI